MRGKYTKEILQPIVAECRSLRQVIIRLGKFPSGGMWKHIASKVKAFEIDTSHFLGQGQKGYKRSLYKKHASEILLVRIDGMFSKTYQLRRALLDIGRKELCAICGLGCIWNGKPLVLQIDHINGNKYDDRKENLRFLCPNCHTQTETFGSRKRGAVVQRQETTVLGTVQ